MAHTLKHTRSKFYSEPNSKAYRDNWDRVFGADRHQSLPYDAATIEEDGRPMAPVTPVAYRTVLWGIESLVFADTKGQAKAITARCAADVGWDASREAFLAVRVRRWPERDADFRPDARGRCIDPRHWTPGR